MKKIFVLIFIFTCSVVFSQSKVLNQGIKLSHPLSSSVEYSRYPKSYKIGADSLKIVAILVEFQEDTDPLSTGNGKFDLSNKYYNSNTQRDTVIDSPPYDSAYFADHLLFVKNYFEKSSKGKLNINYEIFGKVLTLPKAMKEYSPQRNENNFK